jgi:hypothetical protein
MIISANFYPYRLVLQRKEPASLEIVIRNDEAADKLLSMELFLGADLGMDRGALKASASEKIGILKPGEQKRFRYDIFPKPFVQKGEKTIEIVLFEHYRNFDYVTKKYSKKISLIVE